MNTTTTLSNSPTQLPPPTAAALTTMILAAYDVAVENLKNCPSHELAAAKNALEWGSLHGSKVLGVRNTATATEMLRRVILNGVKRDIVIDREGNSVYVFQLTNQYKGKGFSPLVRMRDWCEDVSRRNLVKVGVDYDDKLDEVYLRLSCPAVAQDKIPHSDYITVILGPNQEFISWHCGEPRQIYTQENLATELLDSSGNICLDNLQLEVGLDHDYRTRDRRFRMKNRKSAPAAPTPKPGINSLGATLALDTQEVLNRLHQTEEESEAEQAPAQASA